MRLLRGFIAFMVMAGAVFMGGHDSLGANPDHYNSGLLAMKTGNLQEAVQMFSRAIELNANDHRFYNDRGVAYKRLGNLEGALADYSKALELKPDYTNAFNNRGVVYLQQGKYDEALRDFNEALKFGGIEGKIYTNMGIARAGKGDHRSAIKDFDVAVSYRPLDYRSFLFMGESLEQIGDREKALKMFQVAMGLIREPDVISQLEKKIANLEKSLSNSPPTSSENVDQKKLRENLSSKQSDQTKKSQQTQSAPKREIVLASPPVDVKQGLELAKTIAVAPVIENMLEIEKANQEAALRSFSNPSAEIFKQGLEFIQKSDPHKALVRFEDARQLEKRNRNALAVAWCQLNICRLYNSIGEGARASDNCEQALRIFNSLKAHDEMSMTLIELGNIKKASGLADQASSFYSRASQEAVLAGRRIGEPNSNSASSVSKNSSKQIVNQTAAAEQTQRNLDKPASPVAPLKSEKQPDHALSNQKITQETFQPPGPVKNPMQSRASDSMDKFDTIGRGPVLWGSQGPSNQSSRASTDVSGDKNVSARVRNVESKLAHDQLLPEKASQAEANNTKTGPPSIQNPQFTQTPKEVIGVEALAAVMTKDTDASRKEDKSGKKSLLEANKRVSQKSIDNDLAELRKLRKSGDEKQMTVVLEKLAEKYSRNDQFEKALSSLSIALAFREKIDFRQNEDVTFNQRGLINERLGNLAQALEDYTRALSASTSKSKESEKILESKSRSLAGKMGLDVEPSLDNFRTLWLARSTGDISGESRAFYNLAKLYSKAQRFNESLNYFDKSSAALMTDKAKVLEKLGRFEQAQKEMDQALETFKKLDYSQYLNIMRNSGKSDRISRN